MGRVNKKFGKRTNEFYVLEIDSRIQVILILLPRNRDLVLTWEEEKEIEELFILQKYANNLHSQNICFVTPIAKIIKNYLQGASINFFVSCFPQL